MADGEVNYVKKYLHFTCNSIAKNCIFAVKIIIMTAYTIRIDNETKSQFDLLCKRLGLSVSTAFNLFIKKSLREQAIPFRIDLNSSSMVMENAKSAIEEMRANSARNGLSEMSLEEINEEIRLSREAK